MKVQTIEARQVQVGDRIFNKHAYHPSAAWLEVREVHATIDRVKLITGVYDKYLHPREGIAVQRRHMEVEV